jgi:hypothetical protein
MPRKLLPADLNHARRLYEAGDSFEKIAPVVGIHAETLRQKFHILGWPVRSVSHTREMGNNARYLALYTRYLAGETAMALATEVNMSCGNLTGAWKRRGWTIRDSSETMLLRMSTTAPDERKLLAAAAHEANRGRTDPMERRMRRAATRERLGLGISPLDRRLAEMLPGSHLGTAIGPYNADVTIGCIAVECYGGQWHGGGRAFARWPKRVRYLLDHGWSVLVIWIDNGRHALSVKAANYALTLSDIPRLEPASWAQYRVIWGNGQEIARGCAQDDDFPIKPAFRGGPLIRCPHDDFPW